LSSTKSSLTIFVIENAKSCPSQCWTDQAIEIGPNKKKSTGDFSGAP